MKTAIFPSRYVQGKNSIKIIGDELSRLGNEVLCLLSPSGLNYFKTPIKTSAEGKVNLHIEAFNRECCDPEIERLVTCGTDQFFKFVLVHILVQSFHKDGFSSVEQIFVLFALKSLEGCSSIVHEFPSE